MKFYKGKFLIRERNHEYSRESENATKLIPVHGYLCKQEPSIGIYREDKWRVILLDVGQIPEANKRHAGTQLTFRRTLKDAKKVVEIVHENIEEFNTLLKHTDGILEAPQWYKDIRKGE